MGSALMTITGYQNLRTGLIFTQQGGYAWLGGRETLGTGNPPDEALEMQRGDTPTLRLRVFDPQNDNEAALLPAGTILTAALKAWNGHNGDPLAQIADDQWDKPASLTDNLQLDLQGDPGGFYTGVLDLGSVALSALLPAGAGSVYCHLQIQTEDASHVIQSSQWIPVIIRSDVVRAGDAPPTISSQPSPSAPLYCKDITSLTGGGATALDGIATAGKTKLLATIYVDAELQDWRLFDGTTAEDAVNGIVRPDDYNASTNAQIWKRVR